MSAGQSYPRKSSISNITVAAVAPLIGMQTFNATNFSNVENLSSGNRKLDSVESVNKHTNLPQLVFNTEKSPQQQNNNQIGVSPNCSPTIVTNKKLPSTISHSHASEIDSTNCASSNPFIVNNNYITSPIPPVASSGAMTKGNYGITATQLTGVKNWWKTQMEYVSSDEEW